MEIHKVNAPVLDYAGSELNADRENRSTWPTWILFAVLIWAFLTLRFWSAATTSYSHENFAQFRTQVPLLICAALRVAYARMRKERNKGWVFYMAILFLAVPIWAVISPPLCVLGWKLWGGPIFS